jgi:hypothetical protein
MKNMVKTNNTTGATIYDLGNIMQAVSLSELNRVLKETEKKTQEQAEAERQSLEALKQQEIDARIQEKQMQLDHDDLNKEKDRRRDLLVAEIRAAGYGSMVDLNENNQSDFQDVMANIKSGSEFQETMDLQNSKVQTQKDIAQDKANIERDKINAQMKLKEIDLQIARENKNKSDVPKEKSKAKKPKK